MDSEKRLQKIREYAIYLQSEERSENMVTNALVFTAIVMRHADGLEIAMALRKSSPGAAIFFVVQAENSELAVIAKQHGNGTCLPVGHDSGHPTGNQLLTRALPVGK